MDEKRSLMASTNRLLMEKVPPTHEPPLYQQQQQQQNTQKGLQCPRCDSSNTKFCYYNNYSLSQPRHFCKACKRYWTRGGTLRNVPVGGGCRKNKRSKRSASSFEGANTITSTSNTTSTNTSVSGENPSYTIIPTSQSQIDSISATSNHINPLLVGLPSNPSDLNIPFLGRFSSSSSRALSISMGEFDHLQPQLNALGLGFSSGLIMSGVSTSDVVNNGFINPSKEIQDVVVTTTSNPLLPSYTSLFGSSSSPTMATLLASSFHKQKLSHKDTTKSPLVHFHSLTNTPLGDLQMNGHNEARNDSKGVKIEPDQSRVDWNLPYQNQMEPNGFSDPYSLCWNNPSNAVGAWHDPANIGPSVTSLI